MTVKRIFHPIGQGAFYTEHHRSVTPSLNVVYDCGGSSQKIVKNAIQRVFSSKERIDAVFISHFHDDYINGLEFLLSHCDVKKIILPTLTDSLKILYVVQNTLNSELEEISDFSSRLILTPDEELGDQICYVEVADESSYDNREEYELINLPSRIQSGCKLYGGIIDWVYVPFHIANQTVADKLLEELKSKGVDINDIMGQLKSNKAVISEAYKKVVGDNKGAGRNANSLCIYSGKEKNKQEAGSLTFLSKACICRATSGCLYLGDFEAQNAASLNMLKSAYASYWSSIMTVQIPHHGSKENFSLELINKETISVISADPEGRYKHPSDSVVKDILVNGGRSVLVTKDPVSIAMQLIGTSVLQSPRSFFMAMYECKYLADIFPEWYI